VIAPPTSLQLILETIYLLPLCCSTLQEMSKPSLAHCFPV